MFLGIDHPQGPEKLIHQDCKITFHIFVPNDLEKTLYIHFTLYKVHSHAPPPLNKPPLEILNEVIELVHQMHNPDLTLGKHVLNQL